MSVSFAVANSAISYISEVTAPLLVHPVPELFTNTCIEESTEPSRYFVLDLGLADLTPMNPNSFYF